MKNVYVLHRWMTSFLLIHIPCLPILFNSPFISVILFSYFFLMSNTFSSMCFTLPCLSVKCLEFRWIRGLQGKSPQTGGGAVGAAGLSRECRGIACRYLCNWLWSDSRGFTFTSLWPKFSIISSRSFSVVAIFTSNTCTCNVKC